MSPQLQELGLVVHYVNKAFTISGSSFKALQALIFLIHLVNNICSSLKNGIFKVVHLAGHRSEKTFD